jgi:hypothetical protein
VPWLPWLLTLNRAPVGPCNSEACSRAHAILWDTTARPDVAALQGKDYTLIREDDLIGVLPRSGATAADVPELQPLSDRVLLKVQVLDLRCIDQQMNAGRA